MPTILPRAARFAAVLLAAAAPVAPAAAQTVHVAPHIATATGPQTVMIGGRSYIVHGLAGAGRLPAATRDFAGDTLGSFSAMAIAPGSWRRDPATGAYEATLFTLPDRGPNFALPGKEGTFFSNYAARIIRHRITFTPETGAPGRQGQLTLSPEGGTLLSDFEGRPFTGLDPKDHVITQNGVTFGAVTGSAIADANGRIALDAEGLAVAPDGTFYVSDEYQAAILHFAADGKLLGVIPAPAAIQPRVGGAVNHNAGDAVEGQTGRRANQGLEALSISPDGTRLFAMLQSAVLQDATLENDPTRTNTRVLVYDISTGATPQAPVGHYVLQLPVFNRGEKDGTIDPAKGPNRTAAQSEMLALGNTQFLFITRDGNGIGNAPDMPGGNDGRPMVFKAIWLADIAGATNLAGTPAETAADGRVTTAPGVIDPAIRPVAAAELINMLNPADLARFGLGTATGAAASAATLSEKWEALALVPALDPAAPDDWFLLVGNDNDFQTASGVISGGMTNGQDTITAYDNGFANDSMVLVYRLTLPKAE